MKFCVNINSIRINGKTGIQINSGSDVQGIKTDIAKLYKVFV